MTEPDRPPRDPPDDPIEQRDPLEAARLADEQLRKQHQQWGPVHRLVAGLAALAAENHFTEKISQALRGER